MWLIVIQQAQGLIGCPQPNLQRRLAAYEALRLKFDSVRLAYIKRDYNQAAYYPTTKTDEQMHLKSVSRVPEKIMKIPESSERKDDTNQSPKSDHPNGLVSDPVPNASDIIAPVKMVTTQSRFR
ncbi:hypothetical protein PHMEG_00020680 [Phytophthora megakarya]|uniref:RNase H type-1 domain-containing protein n=1 Tax=Phytophthora megakarya TaxID=4795 RepID=A0A225VQ13_9STRA|nr:hypothetical protein PHMEG_00020680 [Phytophthora megakarya]